MIIFALGMQRLKHMLVWLSRMNHCKGFGIQSPTDYWFVRYVINEQWPYYQYEAVGKDDDWLTRKLGLLYFRIANWLQPKVVMSDGYQDYLQIGCKTAMFNDHAETIDLVHLKLNGDYRRRVTNIYNKVNAKSVMIIEDIRKDMSFWREVTNDEHTGITYDLFYCGIVMFDKNRHKMNYIINF
jgi:hypothetical protein